MTSDPREQLGRLVREIWVAWAREQAHPHAGWLTGWDELDEGQREVDMRIGEAVAAAALPDADPVPEDAGRDLRREALAVAYAAGRRAERERIAALELVAVCTCGGEMKVTDSGPVFGQVNNYLLCGVCGNTGYVRRDPS